MRIARDSCLTAPSRGVSSRVLRPPRSTSGLVISTLRSSPVQPQMRRTNSLPRLQMMGPSLLPVSTIPQEWYPTGKFLGSAQDCANRKPGEKFLVTDSQGYQQVFGAKAINTNDAGLCFVQPDRRPPTVKLSTSPMLRWVVGDEAFLTNPNALVGSGTCTQAKLNQICVDNKASFGTDKDKFKFLGVDKSVRLK